MKLPPAVNVGVQSLGRVEPDQTLQTAAGALSRLTDIGMAWKKDRDDAQQREAGLAMSKSMSDFHGKYTGKEYYTPDEIPDDIDVRRTDNQVGPDGETVEVPRENIPAYEVYPKLYQKFAEANAAASAGMIDDETVREQWMLNTKGTITAGYTNAVIDSNEQQDRYLAKQLAGQIENELNNQKYGVAEALAQDIKDPVAKQAVMDRIAFKQEDDYYVNLMLAGADDPRALDEMQVAIAALRDEDIPSNLSPSQRLARATALESAVDKQLAQREAIAAERKQQITSDAWLQIDAGDPRIDESFVQSMFDDGLINGSTMTAMKRAIIKGREAQVEEQAVAADLDSIAAGGYGIDPKDKKARAAVDRRYEQYKTQSGGENNIDPAVRIMREFKVVPSEVQGMFRANNRADGPALAQAAELWRYAASYAPQSLNDFNDNEVDVIKQVAARMDMGVNAPDAVEQIRRLDMMTPQQKVALKGASKEILKNNEQALAEMSNDQESFKNPWGWVPFRQGVPDLPMFMRSEFDAYVESYMPQTGFDIKTAQRMAFNEIAKRYDRTDVNGKNEIMKYPPKAPTEQIRSLVADTYKGQLGEINKNYGRGLKFDDIKIQSDQRTELEIMRGIKPTYRAFVITDPETNTIEELPRFQWDPEKAAKSRRDNLLKEAKAKREEDIARGKLDFERRRANWRKQQAEKKQRLDKQWKDSMGID